MTGTGRLIRLILRRDRVLLPLWVVLIGVVPAGTVASLTELFPTAADQQQYARVSGATAGFVALYGPLHGTSLGELTAWRVGFVPVVVALLSLLTVIRHTRADEEAGRTELVGAAAVGRFAATAAVLITTTGGLVVLGLIVAGTMIAQGQPAAGSVALGAEFALAGFVFAAVGAITAQLSGGARGARALAVVVLVAAWVLRLAGDVSTSAGWLSRLSPIGWVQRIFPYGENRWVPAGAALLFGVLGIGVAVVLSARRDLGAGLLPARPGPARAADTLRSPLGLAWRLHRGPLAGWVAGFAALGVVFGGVGGSVADLTAGNRSLTDMFGRLGGASTVLDSYFAAVAGIVGLVAAGYAVQAALRLRDEEVAGHAEAVLSTPAGRLRWAASHLVFALLGPALALAAEGVTSALVHGDDGAGIIGGALAQLPAVWVLAAVAVLLAGVLPRLAPAAWGAPLACLLLLLLGSALRLDQWVLDLSPFTHVPHLPGGRAAALPLVVLTVVAAALTAAGLAGLRRRDVPA